MGSNVSFAHSGGNLTLSYTGSNGATSATIRCKNLRYTYGVVSDESHARQDRAFYPHRRAQGQFQVVVECKGYREYKQLQGWLGAYAQDALAVYSTNRQPPAMTVSLPARRFRRLGLLISGLGDNDRTGSMVFAPLLTFVTISDPSDPSSAVLNSSQASRFSVPKVDAAGSTSFFPSTNARYVDARLYDDLSVVNPAAAIVPDPGAAPAVGGHVAPEN